MKNKLLKKNTILTILLFSLGEFLVLPFNIFGLIIFVISHLFCLLAFRNNKILENNVILFISILASLFCLGCTVFIFAEIFKSFVIGYLPKLLITLIFLLFSVFIGFKNKTVINKLSTLFGSISLIFFAIIFLLSLKQAQFSNLRTLNFSNSSLLYLGPIISVLLLPFYFNLYSKGNQKIPSVIAIISSLTINISLPLLPILVFGDKLYKDFDYPLFCLVSSLSVGKLFTRIDAFLYFFVFSVFLIKATVLVNIIKENLKKTIKIPALKN